MAGGLAVGAHGCLRYTKDAEIVIDLASDNVLAAFRALDSILQRPLVPVTAEHFANAELRRRMTDEKGLQVLPLDRMIAGIGEMNRLPRALALPLS